jgi:hypothetical protein
MIVESTGRAIRLTSGRSPHGCFARRALVVVAMLAGACSNAAPPLTDTHESADALARAVLEAFAAKDEGRLRALALSEQEFRDHVWPALPASRPERNLPFDYVWGDLQQKSANRLTQTLAELGGRQFELVRAEFTGGTTQYDSFVVHRDSRLVVRDASGGEHELRVFGSALETRDGRFKVFSYVVD